MATDRGVFLSGVVALTLLSVPVQAQAVGQPLSAIDWLSDTVSRPAAPARPEEVPAMRPGAPEAISTTILAARNLDAVGIIPASVAGLDDGLWRASEQARLAALWRSDRPEPLPALRDLMRVLLLAELDPPHDADGSGAFLLLRIDLLLEAGALDAAAALVEAAGPPSADLFRRGFDIALLMGTEDAACAEQRQSPGIAPTFLARIFCLARGGDWQAADLTFRTAQALGQVTAEDEALLARFIDPEMYEGEDPLPVPERVSPLVLRMYEAIGETLPAYGLPLAFAHSDLLPATGWKARLDAGERLARAGAIDPGQLFALYSERMPAASGGVWSRVEAVQRFETALASGDPGAVAARLPQVWAVLAEAELEVPFAQVHAEALMRLPLTGAAAELAFRVALLSADPDVARPPDPADPEAAFLIGIARGQIVSPAPPDGLARAIAPVFSSVAAPVPLSARMEHLLADGRGGEAVLTAIDRILQGATGDLRSVAEGLAVLRRLGLEDAARRTALQLMLLERRG